MHNQAQNDNPLMQLGAHRPHPAHNVLHLNCDAAHVEHDRDGLMGDDDG